MAMDWEDRGRYSRGDYRHERGRGSWRGDRDRDWTDRAGDEVRSWFGDEDAERRRRMEDDRRYGMEDYGRDYRGSYAGEYGGGYADRGVGAPGAYSGPDRPQSYGGYGYESGQRRGYGGGDYGYSGRGRGYGRSEERGFFDRAGDEVASWFGDEDAERRRRMDAGHRGRGPRNYSRSDDRIREDVNDRLSDDAHIDASDIEVSVESGEVTLNGTVNERFAKRHAEDLAERVSGVKHVQNNLRISERQESAGAAGTSTDMASGRTSTDGGKTTAGVRH